MWITKPILSPPHQQLANCSPWTKPWLADFCVNSFAGPQPHSFLYILSLAASMMEWPPCVAATETVWLAKSKLLNIWLQKKFINLCSRVGFSAVVLFSQIKSYQDPQHTCKTNKKPNNVSTAFHKFQVIVYLLIGNSINNFITSYLYNIYLLENFQLLLSNTKFLNKNFLGLSCNLKPARMYNLYLCFFFPGYLKLTQKLKEKH